jgi:hypothetical protein
MRQAAQQRSKSQHSSTTSTPSPISGLNARDSLAAMQPTDAIVLDNFFPSPTSVDLRKGYTNWVTGFTAAIETLATYNNSTTSSLFAVSGTSVYDATTQGAVGAEKVSGLSNARWQYSNFGTTGGQYLYMVNGSDLPLIYNGSGWGNAFSAAFNTAVTSITSVGTTATCTMANPHNLKTGMSVVVSGFTPAGYNGTYVIVVTGASTFTFTLSGALGVTTVTGIVTPLVNFSITAVDPTTFISINAYKNRLYFIPKNSLSIWYLPLSSLGGAASQIDFTPLFKLGGYLMSMTTWTVDNAGGVEEYAIFISSQGEVAMYAGSDPSNAATWLLKGMFRLGRPVGRRATCRVGSDVIVLGADGFYPLSKALLTDRSQSQDAISNKIVNLVSNDVQNYGDHFGWEAILYPIGSKLIVNVPQTEGTTQYQYVQNTISGAWCRFTNWNANCFALLGDSLYYGGNLVGGTAVVAKADYGNSDNGAFIFGEVKTAFNYFGSPGQIKSIKMLRPVINTSGSITPAIGVDVDFNDSPPPGSATFIASGGSLWNVSLWNTFYWGDVSNIKETWRQAYGVGYCAALHMKVVNNASSLQWLSVDYVYETGGVI